jgi:uncharacterized SAM-dependent methyltransferase
MEFIDLARDEGYSSLLITEDRLEVCGVLSNYALIAPRNIAAGKKLLAWLECWIEMEEKATAFLDDFGCVAWLYAGVLMTQDRGDYDEYGKNFDEAVEVTAPESQAFLDAVNAKLGTDFKMDEFAGR